MEALEADRIYHLVILDLRLPERPGEPAPEDVAFGLQLLEKCRNRNQYPIPGMFVISGELGQTQQTQLDQKVNQGFAYGRVLSKGNITHIQQDIDVAMQNVARYLDIGIHLHAAGRRSFPVLSPRDEDLLRRSLMVDNSSTGVDLEWWSAEYMSATGDVSSFKGWTNVLMGKHLPANADPSLTSFFKFAPIGGTDALLRDAKCIEQRLSHIHVISSVACGDRSLLVTRSATGSNDRPISLQEYLQSPSEEINPHIPLVAQDVVKQVYALGDERHDQVKVSSLLWGYHSRSRIKEQLEKHLPKDEYSAEEMTDGVLELFDRLSNDDTYIPVKCQSLRHGDLNTTNVALSLGSDRPTAYIFDASGCDAGLAVSDLAMLEVTAILHQDRTMDCSLLDDCQPLYKEWVIPSDEFKVVGATHVGRNTLEFVAHLRRQAITRACDFTYAIAVFDHAIRQLGGLPWSPSKIVSPSDAAGLVISVAQWIDQISPAAAAV